MKTGLLVIATGEKYRGYAKSLIQSAKKFFVPHIPVLFSDEENDFGLPFVRIEHEPWPGPTLHRYDTFLKAQPFLLTFDQLFYCDADMLFVAPVGEEIFSEGITATLHPGYVGTQGTPERRRESRAWIPQGENSKYYCGGFNGGKTEAFLDMAVSIRFNIERDASRGITAIWNDESHLNHYLHYDKPAKVLDPSYCYPDVKNSYYTSKWEDAGLGILEPKILALEKS